MGLTSFAQIPFWDDRLDKKKKEEIFTWSKDKKMQIKLVIDRIQFQKNLQFMNSAILNFTLNHHVIWDYFSIGNWSKITPIIHLSNSKRLPCLHSLI